jgi:hypothetical protein
MWHAFVYVFVAVLGTAVSGRCDGPGKKSSPVVVEGRGSRLEKNLVEGTGAHQGLTRTEVFPTEAWLHQHCLITPARESTRRALSCGCSQPRTVAPEHRHTRCAQRRR